MNRTITANALVRVTLEIEVELGEVVESDELPGLFEVADERARRLIGPALRNFGRGSRLIGAPNVRAISMK